MEIVPIALTLRGHEFRHEVPGEDAPPLERMIAQVEMLVIAMIAMEDPRVDEVLQAFGVVLQQEEVVDGESRIVTIFPPTRPT